MKNIIFLCTVLALLCGCSSSEKISKSKIQNGERIEQLILNSGKVIKFANDPLGYAVFRNNRIESFNQNGNLVFYDIDDVSAIYIQEESYNKILWIGGAFLTLIISYLLVVY